MRHFNGLLVLAAVFAISACQKNETTSGKSGAGRFVTNGVIIKEKMYPAVVDIGRLANSRRCTATFIRSNPPTLLTASHCLSELPNTGDTTGGIVFLEAESVRTCVPKGAEARFGKNDLAIVVFSPKDLKVPKPASIARKLVPLKLAVTMVGYGRTDARKNGEETKRGPMRLGRNRVHEIVPSTDPRRGGMIGLRAKAFGELNSIKQVDEQKSSGSAQGDSGGPLFAKVKSGEEVLIGVVSGGRVEGEINFSYYVNLADKPINEFLEKALEPEFLKAMGSGKEPADYAKRCQVIKAEE